MKKSSDITTPTRVSNNKKRSCENVEDEDEQVEFSPVLKSKSKRRRVLVDSDEEVEGGGVTVNGDGVEGGGGVRSGEGNSDSEVRPMEGPADDLILIRHDKVDENHNGNQKVVNGNEAVINECEGVVIGTVGVVNTTPPRRRTGTVLVRSIYVSVLCHISFLIHSCDHSYQRVSTLVKFGHVPTRVVPKKKEVMWWRTGEGMKQGMIVDWLPPSLSLPR